jgi:hypothetical protein
MTRAMNSSETIDTHGFDSPRAKAYLADFLEDPTLEFVEDTFEFDPEDLAETTEALLAAEIVAALMGAPAAGLPDAVKAACKGKPLPNKKVLTKTRMAVRGALAEGSAIRRYWQDKGLEPWLGAVKNLLDRLT